MNDCYVELLKNQFCSNWIDCEANTYTDARRQSFHNSLKGLYEELKGWTIPAGADDSLKQDFTILFEVFSRWSEVISMNTDKMPHREILICLERILYDWLGSEADKYLLTLSDGEYLYRLPICKLDVLNNITEGFWHVHFDTFPIELALPKYFSEDMFFNVVLFHELGHFVESYYDIDDKVFRQLEPLLKDLVNNQTIVNQSFPFLAGKDAIDVADEKKVRSHICEYIADLFGAQYVSNHIMNYASYKLDKTLDKDDEEHPCWNKRNEHVTLFLTSSVDNLLINAIKDVFAKINKEGLIIRFCVLDSKYFLEGKPHPISNDAEMVSVYKHIWDMYIQGCAPFMAVSDADDWRKSNFGIHRKLTELAKVSINLYRPV